MTYFSLLSQLVRRASMSDSVPSHFLPSLTENSATAMAYQKRPWHQKTDRFAERTKAGLDAARKRGPMVGRKRRMTPSKIASAKQLLSGGMVPLKRHKI